jgi:hypothetical protein
VISVLPCGLPLGGVQQQQATAAPLRGLANEARVALDGHRPSPELVPVANRLKPRSFSPAVPSSCHSEHDASGSPRSATDSHGPLTSGRSITGARQHEWSGWGRRFDSGGGSTTNQQHRPGLVPGLFVDSPTNQLGWWAPWVGVLLVGIGNYLYFSAPGGSLGWLLLVL